MTAERLAQREEGHPAVSAVVLAAGCSTRMGRQKVLMEIDGQPLLRWVTDAALASAAQETIVVTGCEATRVTEAVEGQAVRVVFNGDYAEGLSTSVRAGVRAVDGTCDAALFLMGDQPFVTAAVIDRFIAAFVETGSSVVRAMLGDRPANPVLMCADLFPELLQQDGDVGGRAVAARHAADACLIQLDARTAMDVDAPADFETARSMA